MPDGTKSVVSAEGLWSGRIHTACMWVAEETKFKTLTLTPEDIQCLEGAKHYIEIALQNDANNKAEKAA